MKIPHSVVGRTRISDQPANYLRAADFTGGARAISQGLADVASVLEERKQRQDSFTRMKTLSGLSNFETQIAAQLAALKRDQSVDIANFPQQAAGVFDNERDKFIANNVPPELQPEFRYRTDLIRQRVIADALEFQYESQDAFFKQAIKQEYDKARLALEDNPDALEEWQTRLAEYVVTTDLPEAEKVAIAREMNIGLQALVYKREMVNEGVLRANLPPNSPTAPLAATLLMAEEGFRAEPYWDVNAYRIGYGSDTITQADGTVVKVKPGMKITEADARRDLARRIGEFEATAARQTGVEAWAALPVNARAALTSVAYNYGSLPNNVVRAVQSGNLTTVANAVESLRSNPERRKREAAIIRGQQEVPLTDLDKDERFAALPYETRVALRADAESEIADILTKQRAEEKALYDQRFNSLLNGIADGTYGMAEINAAYNNGAGWLTDFDDRMKAERAWRDRNEKIITLASAQEKLADDAAIWDPTSPDDKKRLNALFNQWGPEALRNHDMQYVRGLAMLAARTHDIPTDAIGMLSGMTRSNDITRANFAYNALAMLQEQAPEAYAQRVDDDLASRVAYWRARKDTMPEEELALALKGGMTTAERQQRMMLRKEAEEVLRQKVDKVPQAEALVNEFVQRFNPWGPTGAPELYGIPWAARGLEQDFRTAFIDAYEMYGNLDEAKEAAFEQLGRTWGVTEIGGARTLMKYPPERVGYKQYGGSYEWIEREVRETLGLGDQRFQLISDEQTDQEFDTWRRNPDAPPPSYMVAVLGDNGWALQLREVEDEVRGRRVVPTRLNFVPKEEDLQKEMEEFERLRKEATRRPIVGSGRISKPLGDISGGVPGEPLIKLFGD